MSTVPVEKVSRPQSKHQSYKQQKYFQKAMLQKNQNEMKDLRSFENIQSFKQQKTNSSAKVSDAKQKLDNLIEDLNTKLVTHFKQKQEALLNQYKIQLIEQQKKLTQLKNTTNQQQIRARMLQRKAELEKQRNHLIQTNMFFSQKCEQYKQIYTKLVQESRDLQKQIQFLDNQIATANQKKIGLVQDLASISNSDRKTQHQVSTIQLNTELKSKLPQIQIPISHKIDSSTMQKTENTQSVRKIARSLHASGTQDRPKKSSSSKNFQKIDKGIFQKSTLQKVFQQSVEQVKNRRKTKRTMPILKGQQFTEFEKRAIMQIFLGNEQVKRRLYQIIFSQNQKNYNRGLPKDKIKTKISFQQLGI